MLPKYFEEHVYFKELYMKVPTIQLSKSSQSAVQKIIKASKTKVTLGQQMELASYYTYLHSKNNLANDSKNFARTLLG